MPGNPNTGGHHRRKAKGLDIDEDDVVDYSNEPLETSVVNEAGTDDSNPFRDPSSVDSEAPPVSEESGTTAQLSESKEEPRVPRTEVPIEDLLAPPKRKGEYSGFLHNSQNSKLSFVCQDEKISAGYEMVSSPRARVYAIEDVQDPSMQMSIISSGDESWEHLSQGSASTPDDASDFEIDRKAYAEVLKEPSPSPRPGASPAGGKEPPLFSHSPRTPLSSRTQLPSNPNSPRVPPRSLDV